MNTRTRHFYTDPLAAAWMAKHFGMLFGHDTAKYGIVWFDNADDCLMEASRDAMEKYSFKWFVSPDSLHLLEPKAGDYCVIDNERIERCQAIASEQEIGGLKRSVILLDGSYRLRHEVKRIIQRDGKPFFWPEVEA